MGQYSFKYASLEELLEVVKPILVKHGVLLVQKVKSHDNDSNTIGVWTVLSAYDGDMQSYIEAGPLYVKTDGSPRDAAAKVTHAKRIQLIAILSLAVDDGSTSPPQQQQQRGGYENTQRYGQQPARQAPADMKGDAGLWDKQAPHRKAVMKGNANNGSTELRTLRMRLQQAEKAGGAPMPIVASEGKTMSMYSFLVSKVDEVTLSYLYGRVVTDETPPLMATKFLLDEVMEGKHTVTLEEARKLATT
jgi:hypothetical protein